MSQSEFNPPRQEQKEQARQSPLKQLETETAHTNPAHVAQGAKAHQDGPNPSQGRSEHSASDGDEIRPDRGARTTSFPEDVRPSGIDVNNDDTSDSTVDTDGKDHDAKRLGRLEDSEVVSNATLENSVLTPPEGLAGIDSRRGGNLPPVQAEGGAHVVEAGTSESTRLYETAGDDSDATEVRKEKEHVPPNHARVAKKIRIE